MAQPSHEDGPRRSRPELRRLHRKPVDLSRDEPLIVIQATGAARDPALRPKTLSSLRGPRAWALERTLAEVTPPYGLGELAAALDMDAGYVSRLPTGLGQELLIERQPRKPVERVDWEAMTRQVTRTYGLLADNETTSWIAPAGPEQFLRDLSSSTSNAGQSPAPTHRTASSRSPPPKSPSSTPMTQNDLPTPFGSARPKPVATSSSPFPTIRSCIAPLRTAGKDGIEVEKELRRLLPLKTKAEYDPDDVAVGIATKAVERVHRCVAIAQAVAATVC